MKKIILLVKFNVVWCLYIHKSLHRVVLLRNTGNTSVSLQKWIEQMTWNLAQTHFIKLIWIYISLIALLSAQGTPVKFLLAEMIIYLQPGKDRSILRTTLFICNLIPMSTDKRWSQKPLSSEGRMIYWWVKMHWFTLYKKLLR